MLNNLIKNTFTVFRCRHQKSELRVPSTWTMMLNKIRTMFFFVFSFENKALLDLIFQGLHVSTNSPAIV